MAGFGIYQAEPPGRLSFGAARDMLYELLELGRVSASSLRAGRGKKRPPGGREKHAYFLIREKIVTAMRRVVGFS